MDNQSIPTCYRHPDRETRLACSNCGRSVCVECVRSADVGQRCPQCAAPAPRVVQLNARARTPVALGLIALNVAIFLIMTPEQIGDRLELQLAQYNVFILVNDEWWRTLTAAFLHARDNPLHLLFNMYALYLFGPQLERTVGSIPFALMYLASAAMGGLAYFLFGGEIQAVGASGAVFGLFGAWLVAAFTARRTAFGRQQLRSLLILLGINLALPLIPAGSVPFFGGGIAWEAHVGGLVAGSLVTALWFSPWARPDEAGGARRASAGSGVGVRSGMAAAVLLIALVAVYVLRPVVPVG